MTSAPSFPFPATPFYAVEYPGYVAPTSIPKAIQNLGGEKALSETFRKNASILELKLRPEDSLCHPIAGDVINTSNLLLKVVFRRKKKKRHADDMHVDDLQDVKGEFTAQVVGIIGKTVRYRSMADFQYKPSESDPAVQLRRALERLDVDYIRNYRFPPEKEDYSTPLPLPDSMDVDSGANPSSKRLAKLPIITELGVSNARIMPPPMFSRQAIHFNYHLRPSPASKQETYTDPKTGEEKTRLTYKVRWKGISSSAIPFAEPKVPDGPTQAVTDLCSAADEDLIHALNECFKRRAMWTRQALLNQFDLARKRDISNGKHLIPSVSYCFSDGPFRDTLVRFGYDPRTDKRSRIYQRIYFRNIANPVTRPSLTKKNTTEDTSVSPLSHTFDGKVVHHDVASFQLCDLSDPLLVDLVNSTEGLRDECHPRDGFYTSQALDRIRAIVRRKFFTILNEGRVCMDEECADIMVLPDDGSNVTTRLLKERAALATVAAGGKMPKKRGRPGPKAALPAEEAAAARLRVAVAKEKTAATQEADE